MVSEIFKNEIKEVKEENKGDGSFVSITKMNNTSGNFGESGEHKIRSDEL